MRLFMKVLWGFIQMIGFILWIGVFISIFANWVSDQIKRW